MVNFIPGRKCKRCKGYIKIALLVSPQIDYFCKRLIKNTLQMFWILLQVGDMVEKHEQINITGSLCAL